MPIYTYSCPMHGDFERYSKGILVGPAKSQCYSTVMRDGQQDSCYKLCPRVMSRSNINVDAVVTPRDVERNIIPSAISAPLGHARRARRVDGGLASGARKGGS